MRDTIELVRGDVRALLQQVPVPPEDVMPGGVAAEAIADFEHRTNLHVPPLLGSWLLSCNGPCVGPGGLLGINPKRRNLDIEFVFSLHPIWREKAWIPVAGDGFGNYYLVVTMGDFGPGEPVIFVESLDGDQNPAFVVASHVWHFLRFLLKKELGQTKWPFDAEEVEREDPNITGFIGVALPWNA